MRKSTAILFFAALFAAQYAKYAGYLECRLSNYFSSAPACDCERWIIKAVSSDEKPGTPLVHQHYHLDDWFLVKEIIRDDMPDEKDNPDFLFSSTDIVDGVRFPPERPPGRVLF